MVTDAFHQEISPGDIIAYAANNNILRIYLVREVTLSRILVTLFYDYEIDNDLYEIEESKAHISIHNAEVGAWRLINNCLPPMPAAILEAYIKGSELIREKYLNA